MSMAGDKPPRIIRCYRWMWRFWRERRFRRFVSIIQPRMDECLLDVGGYPFNWYARGKVIRMVDVLNLQPASPPEPPAGAPRIRSISGDARELPFPDRSYDIVFSNSVIEHVGSLADQEAFAREARRVGGKLWIQTPARECPLEPHYIALFIHWFPASWHAALARWFSIRGLTGAASRDDLRSMARHTRLLGKAEFERLFPDCEIWTERLLWIFPKSHVAYRSGSSLVMEPRMDANGHE